MKLKLFSVILALFLAVQTVMAAPFNANAKTKRIPAGTKFQLQLLSPLSTLKKSGDDFSLVRGNIRNIVPAKRMSKGAILYLDFDHIVTPNGRQLPLTLSIVGRTDMTFDGGITTTRGYSDAVKKSWARTVEITKNSVEWGNDIVNDGPAKYVTMPLAAIGGGIGGGAYFIYDASADMIRKGEDVNLNTGDVINVILVDPIDVPVI